LINDALTTGKNQRGFTLVEVLVAFAILAVMLGVLYQTFSSGLDTTGRAERRAHAALHAQSVLAAVGAEDPLAEGETFGDLAGGYRWRTVIQPHESAAALVSVDKDAAGKAVAFDVTVTVSWDASSGGEGSVSLTTLRLGVAQ